MQTKSPANQRTAVLYARVSSKEQESEGYSLPSQLKLLRNYAASKSIVIVQEFVEAESAKLTGRTQFNQMLSFLKKNRLVRAILVEKTDRLYRNLPDFVKVDELDTDVHLVKEGEVFNKDSKSSQKLMHNLKVVLAKNYCDNLSEETRKGMVEKVAQGGYPHHAPIGYKNDPLSRTIVVDPAKANFIRKMFEWYSTGDFSLAQIRERCIAEGFGGGRGAAQISKSKVELILKNPFYVGQFRWKGAIYPGAHTPIVSQALFDRVQDMFQSHRRKAGKYRSRNFSFGGLLTCGKCGCSITAEIQKGRYTYYHCTNGRNNCRKDYCREEALETQFAKIVQGITLDENTVEFVKFALKQSHDDETRFNKTSIDQLNSDLEKINYRVHQCYLDKVDGKIDEMFWAETSSRLQREKLRLTEQIANHMQADDRYLEDGVRILELAKKASYLYSIQKPAEKREFLGVLLSNCILTDGKINPTYQEAFEVLGHMANESKRETPVFTSKVSISENWGE